MTSNCLLKHFLEINFYSVFKVNSYIEKGVIKGMNSYGGKNSYKGEINGYRAER